MSRTEIVAAQIAIAAGLTVIGCADSAPVCTAAGSDAAVEPGAYLGSYTLTRYDAPTRTSNVTIHDGLVGLFNDACFVPLGSNGQWRAFDTAIPCGDVLINAVQVHTFGDSYAVAAAGVQGNEAVTYLAVGSLAAGVSQ